MRKTGIVLLVLVAISVGTGGCGGNGDEPAADRVVVQLKWMHQAQFAGMYAADQQGFYAEDNIEVDLRPGGEDVPISRMFVDLAAGTTDFALVGGDFLLEARADGERVAGIAVVVHTSPYVYASMKDSGIQHPEDLVGKRVMLASQGEIQHQALLQRLDIDPEAIHIVPYEYDTDPLTSGRVDALLTYRTGPLGLQLDEMGYDVNLMWVDDYGIHFYADTIVATERLIEQAPDLVERFLRATLRGWRYAIENKEDVPALVARYDATVDRGLQASMMGALSPLIHTGRVELGWMDESVWQQMHTMLLEGGVIAEPIDMDKAYTMQFLNNIYGGEE
jgi:NitT/TauT family transport system substrate-binding protein